MSAAATAIAPALAEKTRMSRETAEEETVTAIAKNSLKNEVQKNEVQKKTCASPADAAEEARWRPVLSLPCQLVVELPLLNFKVSEFLKLQKGSVIATAWRITHDVPLRVNGTLIGWGEFDGSDTRLGVRLTELA